MLVKPQPYHSGLHIQGGKYVPADSPDTPTATKITGDERGVSWRRLQWGCHYAKGQRNAGGRAGKGSVWRLKRVELERSHTAGAVDDRNRDARTVLDGSRHHSHRADGQLDGVWTAGWNLNLHIAAGAFDDQNGGVGTVSDTNTYLVHWANSQQ